MIFPLPCHGEGSIQQEALASCPRAPPQGPATQAPASAAVGSAHLADFTLGTAGPEEGPVTPRPPEYFVSRLLRHVSRGCQAAQGLGDHQSSTVGAEM